ncbi:MAG: DUF6323 family protein, partial [Oscillospiraceae bacterium]
MEEKFLDLIQPASRESALARFASANETAHRYGLSLTEGQMLSLLEAQRDAARTAGRVEFGGGVLDQLMLAFCDSPYLRTDEVEQTLAALNVLFYSFKNDTEDFWADDDLIHAMRQLYDEDCGSLELMG